MINKRIKINEQNDLIKALKMWYLNELERAEIDRAREYYEREFKGEKTSKEDLALLELLEDINAKIDEKIEKKLEEQELIVTKGNKRYFTSMGYELANALKDFKTEVLRENVR